MTTSTSWAEEFRRLDDQCPWPGPRPFTPQDEERYALVGRDDDVEDFLADLLEHSLMVLHGDSGVGKSSLLNVGLLGQLRERGYALLICNQWGDDFDGDIDVMLRAKLVTQLGDEPPTDADLVRWLDGRFGDRAVIVFDQFEEMIRYESEMFAKISDWVVRANATTGVRIVLSLRSEYVHELTAISGRAKPFSMSQYRLPAFTERDQIEAVISATDAAERGRAAIAADPARVLADAWDALPATRPERGLLFLQAVLYLLYRLARTREPGDDAVLVETDDVLTLLESAGVVVDDAEDLTQRPWTEDEAVAVFAGGLRGAIQAKLDLCEQAAESVKDSLAPGTVDGVRGYIRRAVRSLSSGGYKLVREQWDLAAEMLRRELDLLRTRVDVVEASAQATFRRLAADPAYLDRQLTSTAPRTELPEPWNDDAQEVTSGLLLGRAPLVALTEELRRVVFALQWLDATAITRTSSVRGNTRTSLIHDGFGPALEQWSDTPAAAARAALSRHLRTSGEVLDWRGLKVLDGDGEGMAHHVNVRWLNCEVRVQVEHAVFVNCDFRGTRFTGCRFEGVVFLNCLMDNVTFEECEVVGGVPVPTESDKTSARERQNDPRLPSFIIRGLPEVAAELARQWGYPTGDGDLVSVTSGIPAIPWRQVDNVVDWEPRGGGVSMVGGRLNSMLVRTCTFVDGGVFAIRHTAGSSLDIVEQTHGRFLIFDSSVRGLSVSASIGTVLKSGSAIEVEVTESAMVDTWFNEGLRGLVRLSGCSIWQLFNASDSGAPDGSTELATLEEVAELEQPVLTVRVEDSGYTGLVNVTSTDGRLLEDYRIDGVTPEALRVVRDKARPMVYRSTPARYELEMRSTGDVDRA